MPKTNNIVVLARTLGSQNGGQKATLDIVNALMDDGHNVALMQSVFSFVPIWLRVAKCKLRIHPNRVGYAFPAGKKDILCGGLQRLGVLKRLVYRPLARMYSLNASQHGSRLLRSADIIIVVGLISRRKLSYLRNASSATIALAHFGSVDTFAYESLPNLMNDDSEPVPKGDSALEKYVEYIRCFDGVFFEGESQLLDCKRVVQDDNLKLTILNSTVSTDALDLEAREASPYSPQRFVIVVVGSIQERKGQMDALLGFSRVVQQYSHVDLHLVGSGGPTRYYEEVLEFAAKFPHRVYLHGHKKLAGRYIRHANIVLSSSYGEGVSRVIREAMYMGVPIVATRISGTTDALRDRIDALLYEPGNIQDLSDKLTKAIRQPELTAALALSAKERFVQKYSKSAFRESVGRIIASLRRKSL